MKLQARPSNLLNHDGLLSLEFAKRGNRTVMTNCYQNSPLRASRSLYVTGANPAEATVYMVEASGSLVAGDTNQYTVDVQEGSNVCLIPQSAAKVSPSNYGEWSTQNIDVSIASKASLTWKTESIIPFKGAKFKGKTVINMAEDATLLWGEILSPGRVTRGEVFEYSDVKTNFQVWMEEDCLIYDSLSFSPEFMDLDQMGLLEDHLYVGSLWFVAPNLDELDMKEINEVLQKHSNVKVGAALIEGKAINVRWLASEIVLLKQEMENTWNEFTLHMHKNL